MKKIHKIIQVWENTPTECKSCITMNRCKNNIFCKYYTHCVDNTPLCNTKVCIVTHDTCCVDYTQSTRLYTDLLHCMHCVVQSMSNYYTIQCKFLPFIWKNLHRAEKFTRTPSLASLTNMRYVPALQQNSETIRTEPVLMVTE